MDVSNKQAAKRLAKTLTEGTAEEEMYRIAEEDSSWIVVDHNGNQISEDSDKRPSIILYLMRVDAPIKHTIEVKIWQEALNSSGEPTRVAGHQLE